MIPFLATFLTTKIGRYVALGVLSVLIISVFIARIYNKGKEAERLRQSEASLKNLRTRIAVDEEIRNLSLADRRNRLERWVRD